ncbi:hypothetical protein [Nostoc sp.]
MSDTERERCYGDIANSPGACILKDNFWRRLHFILLQPQPV